MSDLTKDLAVVDGTLEWYASDPRVAEHAMKAWSSLKATIQQNAEDAAKYRNDGSTHAEGCHTWGPKHYECLVEQYRQCFHDAKRLRALERAMDEHEPMAFANPIKSLRRRADEILRKGEPHDQD